MIKVPLYFHPTFKGARQEVLVGLEVLLGCACIVKHFASAQAVPALGSTWIKFEVEQVLYRMGQTRFQPITT